MTRTVTREEFINIAHSIYENYDGLITVSRVSTVKMNKGGRKNREGVYVEPNPLLDHDVVLEKTETYRWSNKSFPEIVREAQERAGLEPTYGLEPEEGETRESKYAAVAPFANKNKFTQHIENGKIYLVVYVEVGGTGQEAQVSYYVDGVEATEDELDIIARYGGMTEGTWSAAPNDLEATGLSAEEFPQRRSITYDTISSITIGREEFVFGN